MLFQIFNPNWMNIISSPFLLAITIIGYIILIVIMAILLKLAFGFFDAENESFNQIFITAAIAVIIMAICFIFLNFWIALIITLIAYWAIIAARHKTGFGKAVLVSIMAVVILIIILVIVGLVLGISLIALI